MAVHDGKVAVVTGGASGIGRACAERLVRDGARVVIGDVDGAAAAAVAATLGDSARGVECDVADEAAVERLYATADERWGGVDLAVHNAGVLFVAALADTDSAQWRRLLAVNLDGVFLASRAAARRMIVQGRGGVIVNVASGAGRRGSPLLSAYCASKAAVIVMSQALAQELAPHRIRVNCCAPGHVETPLWSGIAEGFARARGSTPEAVVAGFRDAIPWGRFGRPDEVAASVSWLCGPEAEYVSGQCLGINGAQLPW